MFEIITPETWNLNPGLLMAYAGLDVPELDRVKVPGAPNTKRAMHFYMKAAKQGRSLGGFEEQAQLMLDASYCKLKIDGRSVNWDRW